MEQANTQICDTGPISDDKVSFLSVFVIEAPMLLNVLLILLPLVIGYLVPLSSARLIKLVNQ